jgi:hypothetical protein
MKYYIGEIETYIGESQISTMIKFKTDIDPDLYLDALASDFWGERRITEDDDSSLYDFGDKMAGGGRWQEVSATTYNKLTLIVSISAGAKA